MSIWKSVCMLSLLCLVGTGCWGNNNSLETRVVDAEKDIELLTKLTGVITTANERQDARFGVSENRLREAEIALGSKGSRNAKLMQVADVLGYATPDELVGNDRIELVQLIRAKRAAKDAGLNAPVNEQQNVSPVSPSPPPSIPDLSQRTAALEAPPGVPNAQVSYNPPPMFPPNFQIVSQSDGWVSARCPHTGYSYQCIWDRRGMRQYRRWSRKMGCRCGFPTNDCCHWAVVQPHW